VSSSESGRAAAAGKLRERPVPRLIQQVFRKRVTGWLLVTDDSGDVTRVFLREGLPVHAERPTDHDRLDRILTASGLVPAEVVAAADEEVSRTGRRLGEVLVMRGAIERQALAEVLKTQMRRKVTRLFFARQGTFEVYIEPHPYGAGDEFDFMRIDPRGILYPGLRAAYDDDRLKQELAPLAGYTFRLVNVPPNLLDAMGFPALDPTVAALRQRALTLEDLPVTGSKPAESRAAVLALLYSDLLDATALAAKVPAAAAVTATSDALSAPVVVAADRRTTFSTMPAAGPKGTAVPASLKATISGSSDQLRSNILELHDKLEKSSHFEMLGVNENASADEVNAAYMRAVRQYHPDRLAAAGLREIAPQAERVMARMGEASAILRDPKRRAEYIATRSGKKDAAQETEAIIDAERSFGKAEVFLKKGDYAKAIEAYSEAIKGNPKEPQYRAYLAWARFDDPRARKEVLARESLSTLQQVVAEIPKFARGFYWIGQIWKYLNDMNQAERAFKEAITIDPRFLEAEREVRLLEMRRARAAQSRPTTQGPATATRQGGGLFGKILKRNE
jgi:tetratricopeptide (TPR) repeat protein